MANNTGTPAPEDEAPAGDDKGTTPPAPPATGSSPDEVTVLKSRNAGLDAKVTTLQQSLATAEAARQAAEARALELAAGKDNGDQELRAQLAAEQAKAAAALQEAKAARLEAKFPETFAVLGSDAAQFSEDKLAATEARLTGEADSGEAPTPRGNNPPRTGPRTGTPAKPTIESVEAELKRMLPNGGWG